MTYVSLPISSPNLLSLQPIIYTATAKWALVGGGLFSYPPSSTFSF